MLNLVEGDLSPANSSKMVRVRRPLGDGHEGKSVHGRADYRVLREQEVGAKTAD
jgi:hypothetical protein